MTRAMKIFIGIITVIILAFYFNIINFTVDGKEVDAITGIDNIFGLFVGYLFAVLFYKILGFPLIVLILLVGSITFTFYFRFINIRGFMHSIDVIRGKYDNPEDPGEISHFQALTSALSATIGLGNCRKFVFLTFYPSFALCCFQPGIVCHLSASFINRVNIFSV